ETTGARAAVAGNHERRRALAPALPVVRTFRALANGVQLQLVEQVACARESIRGRQFNAQPFRQTRAGFQRVFSSCHRVDSCPFEVPVYYYDLSCRKFFQNSPSSLPPKSARIW